MNEALFLLNAIYEDATTIGEYFELNLENRYILRSLILIKIILSFARAPTALKNLMLLTRPRRTRDNKISRCWFQITLWFVELRLRNIPSPTASVTGTTISRPESGHGYRYVHHTTRPHEAHTTSAKASSPASPSVHTGLIRSLHWYLVKGCLSFECTEQTLWS